MPFFTERSNKHPKGVIGIATAPLGRYREFDLCVSNLEMPQGCQIDWRMGVNVAFHFNNMIRSMLSNDEFEWVWILGDDHTFEPDVLIRLLERDVDVVTPFCLRRANPFNPVLATGKNGGYKACSFQTVDGKKGLMDITSYTVGNAGTLIRRKVCETIPEPWYENGKIDPEKESCDLYFCTKIKEYGFKSYLDLDVLFGHIFHAVVFPERKQDGSWGANIQTP